jgi:hypothetical protein
VSAVVSVSVREAGRVLTVAGLAAWVFSHAGEHERAQRCAQIQQLVEAALSAAPRAPVDVPRSVAAEAAQLWEEAAELVEASGAAPAPHATTQLRTRARSLRRSLG